MSKQLTKEQILKRRAAQKRYYARTREARKLYAKNYYEKKQRKNIQTAKRIFINRCWTSKQKKELNTNIIKKIRIICLPRARKIGVKAS